ncbi:hypothetical protein UPYG_G00120410 [Umbra pygmaea]|uniref:Myb/SANT-like DNA-binding domain-containing protein n=1 Tax=Umbra pygmaea TaxID=75934 RepID=A0ABD0XK79_UMBPY
MADVVSSVVDKEFTYKWTKEQTAQFIKLRAENDHLFTGAKNSAAVAWRRILEKMDLLGKISLFQAKKKWDNLQRKYKVSKDCKCHRTGEGVSRKSTAATWPWFVQMDEVLGQRPSNNTPVLIASISEDSAAVADQHEKPAPPAAHRKRVYDHELLQLMKEDMQFQRESEERRAQESRERMDRVFSLLERMVDKQ